VRQVKLTDSEAPPLLCLKYGSLS